MVNNLSEHFQFHPKCMNKPNLILNDILTKDKHVSTQQHFITEFIRTAIIAHHTYIM